VIRFGVIGYGYWGPNIVRNVVELPDASLVKIADRRQIRLDLAGRRHPSATLVDDADAIINDSNIDAVVIATPVRTHFGLAMKALEAGKHVLVEKPICGSSADAEKLHETATRLGLTLLVDHTFLYTGAIRKMKDLVDAGELGEIYYYDSVRINLGLFQEDVSVIWDLAVHDLSIMDHVLGQYPSRVACTGSSHVPGHPDDIAYMTLFFSGTLIGHINVNWLSPVKLRRTLVGGSRKMIVYDDLEAAEKIRVHDKGVILGDDIESVHQLRLRGYRSGDVWTPQIDLTEALATELKHFIGCIQGRERPLSDGLSGLRVVRVLEAATESLRRNGAPVKVPTV
jgi:predicted dehydrogenase